MNIQRHWNSKSIWISSERVAEYQIVVDSYYRDLNVTEDDLIEARELAAQMSTEDVRKVNPTAYEPRDASPMLTKYPS